MLPNTAPPTSGALVINNQPNMKRIYFVALLSALCVACTSTRTDDAMPVLVIEGGEIQGVLSEDGNVEIYRGIPFAAAPVDSLRWKAPAPVVAWEGVKLCDTFGNASMQAAHDPNDGGYGTEFFPEDANFSEDCLYLNVWTPRGASGETDKKLPVAVWIHGGAFTGGWGFEPEMDGEAWADRDVVLVTINYRLGPFGFLNHPLLTAEGNGHSGNYGLMDQIAALQWVNRNIDKFGGDPSAITVFGQSAGAMSVKNLVASPQSSPLIKRAIIQSGGGLNTSVVPAMTQEDLDRVGQGIMELAGCNTLDEMRAASYQQIVDATEAYQKENGGFFIYSPHTDSVILPQSFDAAAQAGQIADVPYMIGSVADDYPPLNMGYDVFASLRDSISDQPTYIYHFSGPVPTDGRPSLPGAFHSSELWYVFDTLDKSWRPFDEKDKELSERMVDYWTNFVKFGNPNGNDGSDEWKAYTREAPYIQELAK